MIDADIARHLEPAQSVARGRTALRRGAAA
jgi:hypothetical protein